MINVQLNCFIAALRMLSTPCLTFGSCFLLSVSGVSKNPCKESYLGPSAFSEPETRNIRDFFSSLDPVPVFSMAIHSALNAFLYGMAYKEGVFPPNKDETVQSFFRQHIMIRLKNIFDHSIDSNDQLAKSTSTDQDLRGFHCLSEQGTWAKVQVHAFPGVM